MSESTRNSEIQIVLTTALPYLDLPIGNLELLFDGSLEEVELGGLPHRGAGDRASWREGLGRLKKEIAKQEPAATATAVFAASQAVDWAHSIGLNVTDYNVPIAILVALAVKAALAQMRPDGAHRKDGADGADGDDRRDE
ncbi:MAG TPA: hypothetical protein VIZ43_26625 [Trebonia sp.]